MVEDPEFQKAMQRMRHYQCQVRPDGTFEAQDVPNGTYDLTATGFVMKDGQPIPGQGWTGSKSFTIPEGTVTDSVLDLGAIPLTPTPVAGK